MGRRRTSTEKLVSFDDRAALYWFLYVYRLCRSEVLTCLADAPCEPETQEPTWAQRTGYAPPWRRVGDDWFSRWTSDYGLPATQRLREEADATVTIGSAGLAEPRWGFEELPPEGPPDWSKVLLHREERPLVWSLTLTIPGPPLFEEDGTVYRQWRKNAIQLLDQQARKALQRWESAIQESRFWQPERQWFLAPGNAERIHAKYWVFTAARDLTWLAMYQSGASYRDILKGYGEHLKPLIPDDHLRDLPVRAALRAAIRRAADLIHLDGSRLNRKRSGRPRKG